MNFQNSKLAVIGLIIFIILTILRFAFTPIWFYEFFVESTVGQFAFPIIWIGSIFPGLIRVFVYFFGDEDIHGDKVKK